MLLLSLFTLAPYLTRLSSPHLSFFFFFFLGGGGGGEVGLRFKETTVLRRWGVETNVWFINGVDNVTYTNALMSIGSPPSGNTWPQLFKERSHYPAEQIYST